MGQNGADAPYMGRPIKKGAFWEPAYVILHVSADTIHKGDPYEMCIEVNS